MRHLTSALLAAATVAAMTTPIEAQVPAGWSISAHLRSGTSAGGLFLHHPAGAVPHIQVTGLPFALTNADGANAVSIMPDRTVVVGNVAPAGQMVSLYRISIAVSGNTASATVLGQIQLGTGYPGSRGQLAEIAVIGPDQVVVAVATLGSQYLLGPPGSPPLSGYNIGLVDLTAMTVTPISVFGVNGQSTNAIASDGQNLWIGSGSFVYKAPLSGGSATFLHAVGAQCNNLTIDDNGDLVVTASNKHVILNPNTGAVLSTCTAAGGNAMAIEAATGDYILCNLGQIQRMTYCGTPTVITAGSGSAWGNPSGIDVDNCPQPASVQPYGTGCQGLTHTSAAPVIGTTIQFTTTGLPTGTVLGATIMSLTQHDPGISLTPFGLTGCQQYVDTTSVYLWLPEFGVLGRTQFSIPNNPNLFGLPFFTQGAAFAPGTNINPTEAVTSNGVAFIVGC